MQRLRTMGRDRYIGHNVASRMGAKRAVGSFLGGLVMTVVLVMIVPMVVNDYIERYIANVLGEATFLTLSSDVVVNLLVWLIIIGFMLVLGAGGVLKRFGWVGILGMVVAYWLLGDVRDAFVPLCTLAIVLVLAKTIQVKRRKKLETQDQNTKK